MKEKDELVMLNKTYDERKICVEICVARHDLFYYLLKDVIFADYYNILFDKLLCSLFVTTSFNSVCINNLPILVFNLINEKIEKDGYHLVGCKNFSHNENAYYKYYLVL